MADCTQMSAFVAAFCYECTNGFCSIFKYKQVIFFSNVHQTFHLCHITENVNRNHTFYVCTCCFVDKFAINHFTVVVDKVLYTVWVHTEVFVTVNKNWFCATETNWVYCSDKCKRCCDNFVARANACINQRQMKCCCTTVSSNNMFCTHIFSHSFFKFWNQWACCGNPSGSNCFAYIFNFIAWEIRH